MVDQVVAGVQDAAKELGYEITCTSVSHQGPGETAYGFRFKVRGEDASFEFLVNEADVARFGLTLRDYARWEVLDALREPEV
jgi:hypothetical protein